MTLAVAAILITVCLMLAFLAVSLVDYVFGIPMDNIPKLKPYKWLLMYVALAVGIAFALYWQLDLVAIMANVMAQLSGASFSWSVSVFGKVLTGFIIGRGSNYLYDFLQKFLKKPELPAGGATP